jgi:hypothetical protein
MAQITVERIEKAMSLLEDVSAEYTKDFASDDHDTRSLAKYNFGALQSAAYVLRERILKIEYEAKYGEAPAQPAAPAADVSAAPARPAASATGASRGRKTSRIFPGSKNVL